MGYNSQKNLLYRLYAYKLLVCILQLCELVQTVKTQDLFFSLVLKLLLNNCLLKLIRFYFYLQTAITRTIMTKSRYFKFCRHRAVSDHRPSSTKNFELLELQIKLRAMITSLTDRRVQLMSEFIAGIQIQDPAK